MASGDQTKGPARGRKARKRRSPPKARPAGGPTMSGHIVEAVAASKERRGLSLAAVKKALSAAGYDVPRINSRVNQAVRSLVTEGSLVRTAGSGASGSFRISRQHQEGQSRPAAAGRRRRGGGGAAASPAPRGRCQRVAAAAKRGRKRSPAGKNKPRGQRRRKKEAGGGNPPAAPARRRKAEKREGGVRKGARPVGRPRKVTREPPPAPGPLQGQEARELPRPEGGSSPAGGGQG